VSDEADFLRAICLHPDDDAPRLIFADWLDENERETECDCEGGGIDSGGETPWGTPIVVKCHHCDGKGVVSSSHAERAEFIRLGCRLERIPPIGKCAYEISQRLEGLFESNKTAWFGEQWAILHNGKSREDSLATHPDLTHAFASRGFIDEIHCTLAEFMTHAQAIALTHPVRKWVLTDVREYQGLNGVSLWDHETFAIKSPEPNMRSIPRSLFRYLRRGKRFKADRGPIRYKSSALAIADLQQACYHYAREGLLASIKAPATPLAG